MITGTIKKISKSVHGDRFKEFTIKLSDGQLVHTTTHIDSFDADLCVNDIVICSIYTNFFMDAIDKIKKLDLNKLNCMNYHIEDDAEDFWFAQCGLRSLYNYSKTSNSSFKDICYKLLLDGQIEINNNDLEYETKTYLITMI